MLPYSLFCERVLQKAKDPGFKRLQVHTRSLHTVKQHGDGYTSSTADPRSGILHHVGQTTHEIGHVLHNNEPVGNVIPVRNESGGLEGEIPVTHGKEVGDMIPGKNAVMDAVDHIIKTHKGNT